MAETIKIKYFTEEIDWPTLMANLTGLTCVLQKKWY